MTEKQIVRKLRDALSNRIEREADVVYILAESRKLLEDTSPNEPHFALKLYCHWAVHVDLAGRDTTLPFLRQVDSFVASALADNNFGEQHRMFHEFGFLDSFRQLLKRFLESCGLPTHVCDDDPSWGAFLALYASVIEDGSLSCNAQPGDLRVISGVTFTRGRPAPGCRVPFDMVWDIHLLDGRRLTVNVRALDRPAGDEMLFHGLRLH